jgi:hypothetical protein
MTAGLSYAALSERAINHLVVRFQHLHPTCRTRVCKCWNLKNH